MSNIDHWINDNLHRILNISEAAIVEYIKSSGKILIIKKNKYKNKN